VWQNSSSDFTGGASSLNSTETLFLDNTLTLAIQSPVVINRTTTAISVGGSTDPACVYPGVNFAKSLQVCDDVFIGNIPWIDNLLCNFTEDNTDPSVVTYSAPIFVTSTEITYLRGEPVTQTQTDVLHVVVQFQKQISISANTAVVAPVNMFSAVTDQAYSPTTNRGSVSFATSLEWPFTLTAGTLASLPAGLALFGALTETTGAGDCSNTSVNSTCFQEFTFQITPGLVCQLTGIYVIDFTITCRGGLGAACPLDSATDSAVLTLSLQSSDFCAAVQTGITATAQMNTYQDSAHTISKTAFLIDQTGFFLVQVSSTEAAISETVISSISVTISGTPTSLYTSTGGIADAALTAVDNMASSASFAVDFTSGLFVVPTDQELLYSFTVEIGVVFEGNTKRTVFAGATTANTHASSQVFLQGSTSSQTTTASQGSGATSTSITMALIGTLLFLCML